MKQQFDVNKSLLQRLLDAGYPKEDIHHHESDLYIFKTPLTTKVLEEWCEANDWDKGLIHHSKSKTGKETRKLTRYKSTPKFLIAENGGLKYNYCCG